MQGKLISMNRKLESNIPSPFADDQTGKTQYQFSLGTLLMVMVVFSVASTLLLWAAQLPRINEELHAWLGTVPSVNDDGTSRDVQLGMLLFCYSSPLVMAGFLNGIVLVVRWFERRNATKVNEEDEQFSME